MIDVKVIGSGSSGNCYLVNINGTQLLLECGLSFKIIQKALNFKLSNVSACLVTHEHGDHSKAVKDLMKNGINVYATKGTFEALNVSGHRAISFRKDKVDTYCYHFFNRFMILPFEAVHDVREPVSFYIQDIHTKESLLFITDTAYIKYKIPNVDVLMVECNYVKSVIDKKVQDGKLHHVLRNRIVKNHLSLETLKEALKQADLSNLKEMYVLHLSDSNSDEKYILEELQKLTGKSIKIA